MKISDYEFKGIFDEIKDRFIQEAQREALHSAALDAKDVPEEAEKIADKAFANFKEAVDQEFGRENKLSLLAEINVISEEDATFYSYAEDGLLKILETILMGKTESKKNL